MNNEYHIQIFMNELFTLRVVEINNYFWFLGEDITKALGYKDSMSAIIDHVDNKDKKWESKADEHPALIWVNETGLYSLIFSAETDFVKRLKFKNWISLEVIPTMRTISSSKATLEMQKTIDILARTNSQLAKSNKTEEDTCLKIDYNILAYNVINDPNISLVEKKDLFTYDPTTNNPELDMEESITKFLNDNI